MKLNLGFYVQKINEIVNKTEEVGETMNPYYEEIRKAIDENKIEKVSKEQFTKIKTIFSEGTAEYEKMLSEIKKLKVPAKVMGIHKKLEKAYTNYVEACKEMLDSVNVDEGLVDISKFDLSEKEQDKATDTIAFCIQRMTAILLKK